VIRNTNTSGKAVPNIPTIPPKLESCRLNPASIFNKVCPDIILANNLTAKLIARTQYDIISITTSAGTNAFGAPVGTNRCKKCHPCKWYPNAVTPIQIVNDNVNVIAI